MQLWLELQMISGPQAGWGWEGRLELGMCSSHFSWKSLAMLKLPLKEKKKDWNSPREFSYCHCLLGLEGSWRPDSSPEHFITQGCVLSLSGQLLGYIVSWTVTKLNNPCHPTCPHGTEENPDSGLPRPRKAKGAADRAKKRRDQLSGFNTTQNNLPLFPNTSTSIKLIKLWLFDITVYYRKTSLSGR